jgi:F-type H+-transporting ATPase subunit a
MSDIHVSIAPETVFEFLGVHITNSILTTVLVTTVIVLTAIFISSRIQFVPGALQVVVETIIGTMNKLVENMSGSHSKEFFPYIMTFFIFILVSNLTGILPGVGTFGVTEGEKLIPLFRPPTADLNTTISLAMISVIMTQYLGLKHLGFKLHLKKYINLKSPIDAIVGFLEFLAEIAKLISFSFRLFGNVFAGEVLLTVILFLVPAFFPLPFLGLEIFAGFIQAVVFSILTLVFWSLAVQKTH